jgi:hypothetical protein
MHVKKTRPTAPPVLPTTLAAALTAALTVGLAACGTSGSSSVASNGSATTRATTSASATADPLADLSAAAIATKAIADTSAASSVHFTGTGTDSGQNLSFALTVVRGKGCTGTISESKSGSFQVVYLGKSVWIKPDAKFWKGIAASGSDAQLGASLLSGKWLKDSATDTSGLGSLVSVCSLSSLFSHATQASDHVVKGTLTTLNGQPVLAIKDVTQQGTAYVTDTANPELLRLTSTGSSSGTFSFSDFGAPATITPPPASEVVDGSKYGF